ncbi:Pentatricopeptide repeat-containing protein [Platanthera zijinensis]|uniref:Pentatricopeptide repeat-containing protein n=1 Tax=Platanthera zijinensis TaxID=2320716 RepID=A0AAP0FZV1_9ASPA
MLNRACSSRSTASLVSSKPSLLFPSECSNFIQLIRSCRNLKSVLQIHAQLLTRGVDSNDSLRTLLVNSYSFFRRSDFSLFVFNSSPNPSIVLWNSMMRAFTRNGDHAHAIRLYRIMFNRRVEPDKYTFTFVLKACAESFDFETGISIHNEVARRSLQRDTYIGTALLNMYSRLGMSEIASQVFDSMPKLDVVSWNAMIGGFCQNNHPGRALGLFIKMQHAGIVPDRVTILNLFPAICQLSSAFLCRSLHGFITRRWLLSTVANGLIDAYSKCGLVEAAFHIFGEMLDEKDDVSWGTMISGYFFNDCFGAALDLFDELRSENMKPNRVSVLSALAAAAETGDLERGVQIHDYAVEKGMDLDISVATAVLTMHAKCGEVEKAYFLFNRMFQKDVVAWSAMISAFAQSGHPQEAVSIFQKMILEGSTPNGITVMSILPACADMLELNLGKSIHGISLKSNINFDCSVGTAFVAMYAQCGSFISAHNLFEILPSRNIVTWNALMNGYVRIGDAGNAVKTFHELILASLKPDRGTLIGMLTVCSFSNNHRDGTSVHGLVIKMGFESDVHVKNASMDMYAKCGDISAAETIFCKTRSNVDVIAWNTMIAGCMHNGLASEALSIFYQLRAENIRPNLITIVSIIPAAAFLSSLKDGLTLHSIAIRAGFMSHVPIGSSLIDTYSKCGRLDLARQLFDQMDYRDLVSWNAMLAGYAMHGVGECAIKLFLQMKESCVEPDSVSFVSVLSACRHGGFLDDGRRIFGSMRSELCLEPNSKHCACIVDLLGRAGHFNEAWELIKEMENNADASVWGALLGAAEIHSHVKMGEIAVDHLVILEPQSPSHYVILANIYADLGRWDDAGKMRAIIRSMGLSKSPGCSWVD